MEVTSIGFQALSTLLHLKQFLFGNCFEGRSWEHLQKCILLCAQYLPHLKVAGRQFDILYGYSRGCNYHKELLHQQQLPKQSLADLIIGSDVEPFKNLQFPVLESLSLWLPVKDMVSLCDRFSTITALALHGSSPDTAVIMTLLQSVGGRLRTLALQEVQRPLSLAQVFEYCPRLGGFRIQFCNFNDDPSTEWPDKYFNNVKEAHVGNQRPDAGWESLPPGFLMQVHIICLQESCLYI